MKTRCWRSSMVEQLICNQQVAGSIPIASSPGPERTGRRRGRIVRSASAGIVSGGVPERSKGTDCKSVATGFEGSNPSPSTTQTAGARQRGGSSRGRAAHNRVARGSSSVGRAPAFQAGCRGFETRLPLKESAHVAQLVEHVLGKDEVTRSIRVVGSWQNVASMFEVAAFGSKTS